MRSAWIHAGLLLLAACGGGAPPPTAAPPPPAAAPLPPTPVAAPAPVSAPVSAPDPLEASLRSMAQIKRAWSPSFSPDGKQIAFISDIGGLPELYVVPAEGGAPRRVVKLDDPLGGVAWSPDGSTLAFSLSPGGGMNQQIYLVRPDGSDLRRITDGGKDNNWLGRWSLDGAALTLSSNRRDPAAMDGYLFDLASKSLVLVSKNPGTGSLQDLSADRKTALLTRMVQRSDNNLYLVDVKTSKETLLTPHDGPGTFYGAFSLDARTVYLASNKDRDLLAFAKIKLGPGGKPGPIQVLAARDDAELREFRLNHQGTQAALVWNVGGRAELAFLDLKTEKVSAGPRLPAELAGGLIYSKDGGTLAMVLSGPASTPDIWLLDVQRGAFRQITKSPHDGVDLEQLVRPELVKLKAHDGLELSGWLYRPRGAAGPGPLVLSFHGGPEGQEIPAFRPDYQVLLSQGIAVFAPNVRGSAGFGKRFVNLDNGALRVGAVKDIRACAEHMIRAGVAHPKRIGIMGGSYGGYMVMAGLTEHPDLFAAGANFFGIVNFETFFEHSEPWMAAISKIEYGDPEKEPGLMRSLSPIHRLDRVVAPTIVVHGANDTNVPVIEAEQVVQHLKKRGIPVEYILFPDEGHGFVKAENRVRWMLETTRWFARHLGATPGAAAPR